jgi:hypothetical protein
MWLGQLTPSVLPVRRPNGIAEFGGMYVIGGLEGLFYGKPGFWYTVSADSMRQVSQAGSEVWVVHGDGALDKLDLTTGEIFPDLLTGSSRRAWTSCVGISGKELLFGGLGGWSGRTTSISGNFPPEIGDDVVTAVTGRDDIRWVGTEKSGLVRFSPTGVRRWNPGNGLTDTWVTSLCRTQSGLVVGTLHAGLFRVVGDRIVPMPSPTPRVTQLGLWKGQLVVGGMDGAWIQQGTMWTPLRTNQEETTSITTIAGRLTVTTASGIYFL